MATYTFTVDPNGGADYTSLAAWQTAKKTLYSSGDVVIALCRRTGSLKDGVIALSGWTAGVIPQIVVDTPYRHEGIFQDTNSLGNYVYTIRSTASFTNGIAVGVAGTLIDGMQIEMTSTSGTSGISFNIAGGGTANACIVKGAANGFSFGSFGQGNHQVRNSFAYQCTNGFWDNRGDSNSGRYIRVENCTSYGATATGMQSGYGTIFTNCISVASTTADYTSSNSFAPGGDYNVSSDATAPGTNKATGKTSYASYFTAITTGNPHLIGASASVLGLGGTDLSVRFTTDIDYQTRSAWDVGCDEYVSSGSTNTNTATPVTVALQQTRTRTASATMSLSGPPTRTATATAALSGTATRTASATAALSSGATSTPVLDTTSGSFNSSGSSSGTWSHTCSGTDRYLLVRIHFFTSATPTATYNGVSMTQIGSTGNAYLFGLVNPASGANNIVVSWSGSVIWGAYASSWNSVDQTTPTGSVVTATGTGSPASLTASSATNELVTDVLSYVNSTGSMTPTAGQTSIFFLGSGGTFFITGASTKPGASSVSMSWTLPGGFTWLYLAVPLKPSSSGPTTNTRTATPVTAALQATSTRAATSTAALQQTRTRSALSVAAALQAVATRTSTPITAALQRTATRTASSTAALAGTPTRTASASIALTATAVRTASATAALDLTSARTATPVTIALGTSGSRTASATAALQTTSSRTATPVTMALLATRTRTASATIALQAMRTASASAALQSTATRAAATSVALSGSGGVRTASPVTVALSGVLTRTAGASTALQTSGTRTASATVSLSTSGVRTATPITAALRATQTRTASATIATQATQTRTATTTVAIGSGGMRTATPITAALYQTKTRTALASAAILETRSRTAAATIATLATYQRVATADIALHATAQRTTPATVALGAGPQGQLTATLTQESAITAVITTKTDLEAAVDAQLACTAAVTHESVLSAKLTQEPALSARLEIE